MASDVLIVDDSKQLLRILELIFKCAGWHVRTAGQVSEAVELSRDQPPEIVLLDYELPDGTAVDAAEAINALTGQSIPKVLYSGHTKDILEGDSPALRQCHNEGPSH